jgi:predicted DNA-binding protein
MSSKLKQVSVRFDAEELERLEQRASRDRRPLASLIRKICSDATDKPEREGAAA